MKDAAALANRFWRLSQKLNAPIGYSYRGKDVLEAENPNGVGMTGLLGWGGLQTWAGSM